MNSRDLRLMGAIAVLAILATVFLGQISTVSGSLAIIIADVDIHPTGLNLNSSGQLLTCHIELPEGYDVAQINPYTIKLNDTILIDIRGPVEVGDYDTDTILDLTVGFNRTAIIELIISEGILDNQTIALTVSGVIPRNSTFVGSDSILVSRLVGDVDCDGTVDIFDIQKAVESINSAQGDPEWNSNANFAPAWDKVDIFDIVTAAGYYGEIHP